MTEALDAKDDLQSQVTIVELQLDVTMRKSQLEVGMLKSQLAASDSKAETYEKAVADALAVQSDLTNQVKDLTTQPAATDTLQSAHDALKLSYQESESRCETLLTKIQDLDKALADSRAYQQSELGTQINSLKSQLAQKKKEKEDALRKMEAARKKLGEVVQDLGMKAG